MVRTLTLVDGTEIRSNLLKGCTSATLADSLQSSLVPYLRDLSGRSDVGDVMFYRFPDIHGAFVKFWCGKFQTHRYLGDAVPHLSYADFNITFKLT